MMTIDDFFEGQPLSRQIFEVIRLELEAIGPAQQRIGKSQISFRNRKAFAWVWNPGRYLRGKAAPLVLTFSFRSRDGSTRWKEIVEPAPGRFTHHLELYSAAEIDKEVQAWLLKAWTDSL